MADYIERATVREICDTEHKNRLRIINYCGDTVAWSIGREIKALPAADVVPVVRCKDCTHCYETLGGWCCAYGTCVDCIVQPDFYCAFGKRKEGDTP